MDDDLIRRINQIEKEKRNTPKRNRLLRNVAYTLLIAGGLYCAWYNATEQPPEKGAMRGDTTTVDTNYIQMPVDTGNTYKW